MIKSFETDAGYDTILEASVFLMQKRQMYFSHSEFTIPCMQRL